MASIKDVSRLSGYSSATISRYLNSTGLVSKEAGRAIEKAIVVLGYEPNYIARSLSTQKTQVIGVLIPNLSLPFLAGFVDGVEAVASSLGYAIILYNSHGDVEAAKMHLKLMQVRQVDGIIAIPVSMDAAPFREAAASLPFITAIRRLDDLGVSAVYGDDYGGAYAEVAYLIQKGHRDIAFFNGDDRLSTGRLRWEGARQAMADHGLVPRESFVTVNEFTPDAAYRSALQVLGGQQRPTAAFAANQALCIGLLKAVRELGLSIPENLSVISFDGFEGSHAEYLIQPGITANFNPIHKVGEMAAALIVEEIAAFGESPRQRSKKKIRNICVEMEFRERNSVRTIPR